MRPTVREVIANPTLRTRVLAGSAGVERELTWAHSIELPDPWEWMGNGELLMTTGQNFPAGAAEQVHFIRQLNGNGIAGLALAERMAAELTPEAAAEADALGFPVLETAYEVPFVLVARAVAESSSRDSQLTKILRVYELYRQSSVQGLSEEAILDRLGTEVGARLRVVSIDTWDVLVSADADAPALEPEVVGQFPSKKPLPAVTRVRTGDAEYLLLPIGEGKQFALVAEVTSAAFDLVVLQHVSTIASVQAEKRVAEAAAHLHESTRLYTQLVNGSLDLESARVLMGSLGLQRGPWFTATLDTPETIDLLRLQQRLLRAGVPTLVNDVRQRTMVLFPVSRKKQAIPILEAAAGPAGRIGVSDVTQRLSGIADSVREASWASQAARVDDARTAWYGVDRPLFLPGTVTEAKAVVSRVLGVLLAYDEEHGTELLTSLQTYFDEKRSWQAASQKLSIHRQTLIYRMKRVEELTGRHLDDLDDLTELHLALRTRRLLDRETRLG
ncbi:MAG: PucR family transcriptional regulator ligand-binding domain-containing protein [Nocardioidaceae bacterium]|nr:PucR family transcriptional regulator ligand-binding domain-containing protein [Nocardioidaceae bacterium]